ncbi:sn-glycerol-3-phosphate-binding periplasmic protein UgpB [Anaerolineae bacterium]|nr:sn-glycerol-3-phosphate-binding periplasmic protein UgpB [Anaerolineae bacterium]
MIWLVISVLGMTACAPADSPPTAPVRPEGQEIVVWHSYEGALREALLTQIDEFNATNPWRVVIVPEFHGSATQLGVRIKTAVDNGSAPDLVIRPSAVGWSLGSAVVPMQQFASDIRFGLTAADQDDLYPAVLDMTRDPRTGELIGFPLGGEGVVLVYNSDRLAAGNYFEAPTSWPLFQEVCQAMTKDTTSDGQPDVYGFGFEPRADFATAWLNSRGGSIISEDGTRTSFNSEEGVRTLTTLQETAASGCFYRSNAAAIQDFARGKVAMIFVQSTQLPDVFAAVEARGGFRWGVSPVPYGRRTPTLTLNGPAWIMLRSTPARQLAAWLFVRWFSEAPQTVRWAELTGWLPVRRSAAQGMAEVFATNTGFKVAFDLLTVAQAQPDIPQWSGIAQLLVRAVNAAVAGADPAQALNEAAVAADALLK